MFRNLPAIGILILTLAALTIGGCGDSTAPGTGFVAVHMQFAGTYSSPGIAPLGDDLIPPDRTPLSDLIITIHSVTVKGCAAPADTDTVAVPLEDLEDDDCDAVHVTTDTLITLSVSGLDTTLTQFLGDVELLEGDYHHILLGISEALVVTQAGDTVEAHLPGDKDRLKVNSRFTISEGTVTDVMIVFDVHRSVVEDPPGSMIFKVKPVLHHNQGWAKN